MKKSNFTYKALILLVAFVTFSFIVKEENDLNNNIKKTEINTFYDTFELLIVYPSGTSISDRIQKRQCILTTLQYYGVGTYSIESITPCSSNSNAEVITFGIIKGKDNVSDVDNDDEALDKPNHIKVQMYVSDLAFLTIIDDCNLTTASSNTNCNLAQGISGSFGPQ
ncbi:hypothetical protein [Tenacibaculum halocynthiae]|uniref:hypothetical protein n=1 Tax=Tenacibaculum halocynthiae TaxID=1254437 RepID=UPI003892E8E4